MVVNFLKPMLLNPFWKILTNGDNYFILQYTHDSLNFFKKSTNLWVMIEFKTIVYTIFCKEPPVNFSVLADT